MRRHATSSDECMISREGISIALSLTSVLAVQRRTDNLEAVLTGDSADLLDFLFGWFLGRNRPGRGGTTGLGKELLEAGFERQNQTASLFLNQLTVRDAVRSIHC